MKSKEQLIKHLKQHKADTIKWIYEIVSGVLIFNEDFRIVKYAMTDDLRPIIEKETGQKIDFSADSIMGEHSLAIFSEISAIDYENRKLKKQERIELIADVLSDEVLFEGVCLAFDEPDDMMHQFFASAGCVSEYEELCKDEVYRKRKEYMRMIAAYTQAAVNLYGVTHLGEVAQLIRHYEKDYMRSDGFARTGGSYANTVVFNPRYMGICVLRAVIGNMISSVGVTMDGLIVHECFFDELQRENQEWMNRLLDQKSYGRQPDFDEVLAKLGYYSYRELYRIAQLKPMYRPVKKADFFKFADGLYYEPTRETLELRRYLKANFGKAFASKGKRMGKSKEECIDNFLELLYEEASDFCKPLDISGPNDYFQYVFDLFHDYGIDMADMEQTNQMLNLLMKMKNSIRLWSNHGHSPMEIRQLQSVSLQNTTLVPGSSMAAKMLQEAQPELEQLGFQMDLDSNADIIPTVTFPKGMKGEAEIGERKVYPNDPCPCGSGRKYKKCCGRKM